MTQCVYVMPSDVEHIHLKKPDVGRRLFRNLLHYFYAIRTLNLESENLAPALVASRPLVSFRCCAISAILQIELHPVRSRRPSDKIEFIVVEIEENGIADNVAVLVARNKLLRLIDFEILEAVYAKVGKQFKRFGTF